MTVMGAGYFGKMAQETFTTAKDAAGEVGEKAGELLEEGLKEHLTGLVEDYNTNKNELEARTPWITSQLIGGKSSRMGGGIKSLKKFNNKNIIVEKRKDLGKIKYDDKVLHRSRAIKIFTEKDFKKEKISKDFTKIYKKKSMKLNILIFKF